MQKKILKIGEIIPPNKTRKLGQNVAKKIIFIFLKKLVVFSLTTGNL
jgi:hypothetical protein